MDFYNYQEKKATIRIFLEYIQIADYFLELPTITELKILLIKRKKITAKALAESFQVSQSTIETHLKNIRYKTKIDINTIIENIIVN